MVNVSSFLGSLKCIANERAIEVLNDVENLTEERIDEVITEFLSTGRLTSAEGAQSVVRLALLPDDELTSGLFFSRQQVVSLF
ncbi:hypothetical protein L484_012146 [Morus notabilis]|uniref:Uncharacterized protein n=1 Tax=Morus notabilis TaxID=981085 RepID=W9R780_9ROSA|nr:hypothetical protein L484_012146 [Morus notabilis]